MSESNAAERAGRGERSPDRRDRNEGNGSGLQPRGIGSGLLRPGKRRPWVPVIASLLCLLIGLSDILVIFKPEWPAKLHHINAFVPGTLTNVAHSADVIVGLMLLLLSQGLRRRKRRAWLAVLALLVFDLVIHLHFSHTHRLGSAIVVVVLLAALLFFHNDFYATGDQRGRWNAGAVFAGLIIADLAIGLGFQAANRLAGQYTLIERVKDVVFELVGANGPVSFASEGRGDFYYLLTSALGLFTLVVTIYLFLRTARRRARLSEGDAA